MRVVTKTPRRWEHLPSMEMRITLCAQAEDASLDEEQLTEGGDGENDMYKYE